MTVVTELQRSAANIDGLKETLEKRLQSDLGVKVAVKLVEEGTLAEAANLRREGKPKRLLDRRPNRPRRRSDGLPAAADRAAAGRRRSVTRSASSDAVSARRDALPAAASNG
jgi:hypothetical protein